VKEDEILECLLTANDQYDPSCIIILQHIFTAWLKIVNVAAAEHMKGGRFEVITEELAAETSSVPSHNKFPERVFAFLDALTKFRPVVSTLCNESYIMFSLNKTGEWLDSLTVDKRNEILQKTRSEGLDLREKYKQRVKQIEQFRQDALRKKRDEVKRKREKDLKERGLIVDDVNYYGFWQYPDAVDEMLRSFKSPAEAKKALKAQIRFRKNNIATGSK